MSAYRFLLYFVCWNFVQFFIFFIPLLFDLVCEILLLLFLLSLSLLLVLLLLLCCNHCMSCSSLHLFVVSVSFWFSFGGFQWEIMLKSNDNYFISVFFSLSLFFSFPIHFEYLVRLLQGPWNTSKFMRTNCWRCSAIQSIQGKCWTSEMSLKRYFKQNNIDWIE